MISSNQFYFLHSDNLSPYHLYMHKITFGSISSDWTNMMLCPSGIWEVSFSETVLDSSRSIIYSFFLYGASSKYIYFASLLASDGSVIRSRYKSSISFTSIYGATQKDGYLITIGKGSNTHLIIFEKETSSFILKKFFGDFLRCSTGDPTSER